MLTFFLTQNVRTGIKENSSFVKRKGSHSNTQIQFWNYCDFEKKQFWFINIGRLPLLFLYLKLYFCTQMICFVVTELYLREISFMTGGNPAVLFRDRRYGVMFHTKNEFSLSSSPHSLTKSIYYLVCVLLFHKKIIIRDTAYLRITVKGKYRLCRFVF